MRRFTEHKIEFIAKTIVDLGKAFVAVGLASYFFEKFALSWRFTFGLFSVALILIGIYIYPDKEGEN